MGDKERKILYDLIEYPHRLGHMIGKTLLTETHSHWIKFIWYPIEYWYQNDNWKKTVQYFNGLGNTLDIISDSNGSIERVKLTEEIFFKLIDNTKKSLQAQRGSYKSTTIDIVGSILRMLFEPDIRIGIIRKDFTKASKILKNISTIMKMQIVKQLFYVAHGIIPRAVKDSENILTFNFKNTITPEGNINAYGLHNSITGDHLDYVLLDDIVTVEDKISRAEREKTKIRVEEIINFVLDPNKQAGFIGTPWHKEDAWALPLCPPPLKFDIYTLKMLSKKEIEEKRRSTTNITFAANYELKHVANAEALFKDAQFKKWELEYRNGIGHLDKKYYGVDTNALTFCAKKKDGRYQVIGWTWKEHIKDKKEFIKKMWEKYRIGTIYSEDNDDKGTISDMLQAYGIMMKTYHESMNKHRKIKDHLLENGFWELIDFDSDTDPEYLNQILDYVERSEPDDAPDSLSSIGRIIISNIGSIFTNRWKNV